MCYSIYLSYKDLVNFLWDLLSLWWQNDHEIRQTTTWNGIHRSVSKQWDTLSSVCLSTCLNFLSQPLHFPIDSKCNPWESEQKGEKGAGWAQKEKGKRGEGMKEEGRGGERKEGGRGREDEKVAEKRTNNGYLFLHPLKHWVWKLFFFCQFLPAKPNCHPPRGSFLLDLEQLGLNIWFSSPLSGPEVHSQVKNLERMVEWKSILGCGLPTERLTTFFIKMWTNTRPLFQRGPTSGWSVVLHVFLESPWDEDVKMVPESGNWEDSHWMPVPKGKKKTNHF